MTRTVAIVIHVCQHVCPAIPWTITMDRNICQHPSTICTVGHRSTIWSHVCDNGSISWAVAVKSYVCHHSFMYCLHAQMTCAVTKRTDICLRGIASNQSHLSGTVTVTILNAIMFRTITHECCAWIYSHVSCVITIKSHVCHQSHVTFISRLRNHNNPRAHMTGTVTMMCHIWHSMVLCTVGHMYTHVPCAVTVFSHVFQ